MTHLENVSLDLIAQLKQRLVFLPFRIPAGKERSLAACELYSRGLIVLSLVFVTAVITFPVDIQHFSRYIFPYADLLACLQFYELYFFLSGRVFDLIEQISIMPVNIHRFGIINCPYIVVLDQP